MMHSHDCGKHHRLTTMYKKCGEPRSFFDDRFTKTTGSEVGQPQTGWGMHCFHFYDQRIILLSLPMLCLLNNSMFVSSVCQTTSCLSQVSVTQQGHVCLIIIPYYSIATSEPHMNNIHHERNSYHLFMNHDTCIT